VGLPKGKLKKGEQVVEAAAREVNEETGCNVAVGEYAGATHYFVGSSPKAVFYFLMEAEGQKPGGPTDLKEIEGVEWLSPRDAVHALTHSGDRDLISAVFGVTKERGPMTIYTNAKAALRCIFDSPDDKRLQSAISEAWIEIDHQIHLEGKEALTQVWTRTAFRSLLHAEKYLAERNLQQSWIAINAAQRAILANSRDPDRISRAAISLRREAKNKVSGWRSKAIDDLICTPDGELLPSLQTDTNRVIDAVALRDDYTQTQYHRISLRRRHLRQLFFVLLLGLGACLLLSFLGKLPEPFPTTKLVVAAILFGVLGAAVSVSIDLLTTDVSTKVPSQQLGAFAVWMRPVIGATAALMALVLLYVNQNFQVFGLGLDTKNAGVVIAIAFAAGFSERFIVGAIERLPLMGNK
jgi:ADP-ribose pyrophosphatase YjhB (NUDIX family)